MTTTPVPLSRRQFLRQTTLAAACTASALLPGTATADAAAPSGTKTLIGTQLYGWGQYYQRDDKKLADHLGEVLSAIRDAGYDYAEGSFDGANPENNARFADLMKSKGLKCVSLYSGGSLHDAAQSAALVEKYLVAAKTCRDAGFRTINCNPNPIGREKTDAELKIQAASLEQFGAGLNALGMQLGVHNHTPEMKSQAREFHHNFDQTKTELVGFCYDVHWVFRGGIMPAEALKQYGHRIVSWHLRQSRGGIWWEDLDTGDVDYADIAAYARAHHSPPFYTVELALEPGTKITRDVVANHLRSREFVQRTFTA